MVAIDILVPQQGVALVRDEIEPQIPQFASGGANERLRLGPRCAADLALAVAVFVAGRGQQDQPVLLHPQHRDAAAHVLEAAVGLAPSECLADEPRKRQPGLLWVLCEKSNNPGKLDVGELPAAVFHLAPRAIRRYRLAARRSAQAPCAATPPSRRGCAPWRQEA